MAATNGEIRVQVSFEPVESSLQSLEAAISKIKPDRAFGKTMSASLVKIKEQAEALKARLEKPVNNQKEVAQIEKSYKNLFDNISAQMSKLQNVKFDDLILDEGQEQQLKSLTQQIDSFKASISSLNAQEIQKYFNELKEGTGSVDWSSVFDEKSLKNYGAFTDALGKKIAEVTTQMDSFQQVAQKAPIDVQRYSEALNKLLSSDVTRKQGDKNIFNSNQKAAFIQEYQDIFNGVKDISRKSAEEIKNILNEGIQNPVSKTEIENAQQQLAALQKQLDELTAVQQYAGSNLTPAITSADKIQKVNELTQAVSQLVQRILELNQAEFANRGIEIDANITAGLQELDKEIASVNEKLNRMREQADAFNKIKGAIQRFVSWGAVIRMVGREIRQMSANIQSLDKVITSIAVVTNMTQQQLWGQMNTYVDIAQRYASSIEGAYQVSQIYYQQGLQTAEVMELTTETLKMARIAGLDYSAAADYMTVAIRGFNMEMSEAQRVTDVYSALAASTASDTTELAVAMSKTASSVASVGASFESASAMIATMVSVTRESATNIGSALKSIVSRYGEMTKNPQALIDSEGEEISLNKVDKALQSVGISLQTVDHQFRNFDDVILELAQKWDTLDVNAQRYIATIFAGNRQQSRFLALVSNYDEYARALEVANNSEDAGTLQMLKTLDSIESKVQQVKTSFQEMYMNLGIEDIFKGALDWLNKILQNLNKLNLGQVLSIAITAFRNIKDVVMDIFASARKGYEKIGEGLNNQLKKLTEGKKSVLLNIKIGNYDEAKKQLDDLVRDRNINIKVDGQEVTAPSVESPHQYPQHKNDALGKTNTKGFSPADKLIVASALAKKGYDIGENYANLPWISDKNKTQFQTAVGDVASAKRFVDNPEKYKGLSDSAKLAIQNIDAFAEANHLAKNNVDEAGKSIKGSLDEAADAVEGETKSLLSRVASAWNTNMNTIVRISTDAGKAISSALMAWGLSTTDMSSDSHETSKILTGSGQAIGGIASGFADFFRGNWLGLITDIGSVINGLITAVDGWNYTTAERYAAAVKETTEAHNEFLKKKDARQSLQTAAEELQKLKDESYNSAEAMQEYRDKMNTLGDTYPELVKHYDAEGNAIVEITDLTNKLVAARENESASRLKELRNQLHENELALQLVKETVVAPNNQVGVFGQAGTINGVGVLHTDKTMMNVFDELLADYSEDPEAVSAIRDTIKNYSTNDGSHNWLQLMNDLHTNQYDFYLQVLDQLNRETGNGSQNLTDLRKTALKNFNEAYTAAGIDIQYDLEQASDFTYFMESYLQASELLEDSTAVLEESGNAIAQATVQEEIKNRIYKNDSLSEDKKQLLTSGAFAGAYLEPLIEQAFEESKFAADGGTYTQWILGKNTGFGTTVQNVLNEESAEAITERYLALSKSSQQAFDTLMANASMYKDENDFIHAFEKEGLSTLIDGEYRGLITNYYKKQVKSIHDSNDERGKALLSLDVQDDKFDELKEAVAGKKATQGISDSLQSEFLDTSYQVNEMFKRGLTNQAKAVAEAVTDMRNYDYSNVSSEDQHALDLIMSQYDITSVEGARAAVKAIEARPDSENEFWKHILDNLNTILDNLYIDTNLAMQIALDGLAEYDESISKFTKKVESGQSYKDAFSEFEALKIKNPDEKYQFGDIFTKNAKGEFEYTSLGYRLARQQLLDSIAADRELMQNEFDAVSELYNNNSNIITDLIGETEFNDAAKFKTEITGNISNNQNLSDEARKYLLAVVESTDFSQFENMEEVIEYLNDQIESYLETGVDYVTALNGEIDKVNATFVNSIKDFTDWDTISNDYFALSEKNISKQEFINQFGELLSSDQIKKIMYGAATQIGTNISNLITGAVGTEIDLAGIDLKGISLDGLTQIGESSRYAITAAGDYLKTAQQLYKRVALLFSDDIKTLNDSYASLVSEGIKNTDIANALNKADFSINDLSSIFTDIGLRLDDVIGFDGKVNSKWQDTIKFDSITGQYFITGLTDTLRNALGSYANDPAIIASIQASADAHIASLISLIGNAMKDGISATDKASLAAQYGLEDDAFTQTAQGYKLNENAVAKIYADLKATSSLQAGALLDTLVEASKGEDGYQNISDILVHIADLQTKIVEAQDSNDPKIKQYQQELKLAQDILAARSLTDPNSFNFMDNALPDEFKGPENYWNSWNNAMNAMNEASVNGYMSMQDFYNISKEINNMAGMTGEKIELAGEKLDGSAESFYNILKKVEGNLVNIDGKGMQISMEGWGQDFLSGAMAVDGDVSKGIQEFAEAQVKMIDAQINMLKAIEAMEKLDIEGDGLDTNDIYTNVENRIFRPEFISSIKQMAEAAGKDWREILTTLYTMSPEELIAWVNSWPEDFDYTNLDSVMGIFETLDQYNVPHLTVVDEYGVAHTSKILTEDENGIIVEIDGKPMMYDDAESARKALATYYRQQLENTDGEEEQDITIDQNLKATIAAAIESVDWSTMSTSLSDMADLEFPAFDTLATTTETIATNLQTAVDLAAQLSTSGEGGEGSSSNISSAVSTDYSIATSNIENAVNTVVDLLDEVSTKMNKLAGELTNVPDKSSIINSLADAISGLKSKIVTIAVSTIFKPSNRLEVSWSSNTTEAAKAMGNVALAGGRGTLMGELGPELVVSHGHYFTVGNNGAEFVNLDDDAIVFNHLQTKKLLKGGSLSNRGTPVSSEKKSVGMATGNAKASVGDTIKQLEALKAFWETLAKSLPSQLGALAGRGKGGGGGSGGGGGGGGDDLKTYIEQIEKWYNWERQIEDCEKRISLEQAKRKNLMNGHLKQGTDYAESLLRELDILKSQQEAYRDLNKEQAEYYEKRKQDFQNSAYKDIFTWDENGVMQFQSGEDKGLDILAKLNATDAQGKPLMTAKKQFEYLQSLGFTAADLEYNSNGEKTSAKVGSNDYYLDLVKNFMDGVDGWKEELDSLHDTVQDGLIDIEENQAAQLEIQQQIIDNELSVENAVYQALVDSKQAIIDNQQKQLDAQKEASAQYVNGLREALSKEKEAYQAQKEQNDISQLQRRIDILRRTGGSASEINKLQQQLDEKMQDAYFNQQEREIDSIEDAAQKQQEMAQKQIDILTETLEFQKNNGLLWNDVRDMMDNWTDEELADFIKNNTADMMSKSPLEISETMKEIKNQIETFIDLQGDKYFDEIAAKGDFKTKYDTLSKENKDAVREAYLEEYRKSRDKKKAEEAARNKLNSLYTNTPAPTNPAPTNPAPADPATKKGKVITTAVNVRTGPGTSYQAVDTLSRNAEFEILEEKNGWYKIKHNGKERYVSANSRYVKAYKEGGTVDTTGMAWLDGTKLKPEEILSNEKLQTLLESIKVMDGLMNTVQNITNNKAVAGHNNNEEQNGVVIQNVSLNFQAGTIANDYDARRAGEQVMDEILRIARKSGTTSINRR